MKKPGTRILTTVLTLAMLAGMLPTGALAEETPAALRPDYSVTPDYAARYPHGVLEFSEGQLALEENGPAGELLLIRKGGLEGEVSVRLKAIDVNARFGEDYRITVEDAAFAPDPDYTGSLMQRYLEEPDIITAEDEDAEYLALVGYTEPQPLNAEELDVQRDQAIDTVADMLGITEQQAASMLAAEPKAGEPEEKPAAAQWEGVPDAGTGYASGLHALHDAVLGERTPANHSEVADITDPATLLGETDRNLAATAVNGEAAGPSVLVTFRAGENEKRIRIEPVDDGRYGAQKVFVLGLYDVQGGAELGEVFDANVVIRDDETPEKSTVGFAVSELTVEHGALLAELEIVRSGCVDDYAAVTVRTVAGTAREGVDYLRVDGGSTFLPGETGKTVIVPLKTALTDDDTDRSFTLRLASASDNVELSRAEATVTVLAGKATAEPLGDATLMAEGATPIVIQGDDLAQKALDENWEALRAGNNNVYYGFTPKVTVGGSRMNSVPAGGEINFTGIARVEVVIEKGTASYNSDGWGGPDKYVLRLASPDYYKNTELQKGVEYVGEAVSSSDKTITLSFDFSGYKERWSNKTYLNQWDIANQYGISIATVGYASPSYWNNYKSSTYKTNLWSSSDFKTITYGPKIKEIRLYPIQIRLGVYDTENLSSTYSQFKDAWRNGNNHPTSMAVQSSYRTYNGLTEVQETRSYAAGTVTVPETVYAGDPIYYTLNSSDEARNRCLYADGFYRYAPWYGNTGRGSDYINNKGDKRPMGFVLWNSEELPRTGFVSSFETKYFGEIIYFTVAPAYYGEAPIAYTLSPVLATKDIDTVTVAAYDPNMGLLRIGGTVYNDVTLTRSGDGFTWKEGDELIVTAEAKDGYYCDGIQVTRANGSTETVPAGERVMLTNGMTIEPVFVQYDITLELYWSELGTAIPEDKDFNLEGYQIGYTYSGENEIRFTDHGDGSYTFGNLMPGKVLTLWAGPEEGQEKDRTGLWLLDGGEDRVRYDDGCYYLHVGDARAVTVDNKDMRMAYYLNPADNTGGTVVSGQVCTKGQDIKHSTSTRITAKNAEQTASFLSGVTVSAVCLDPAASRTVRGKTYYTTAETDEKGNFTIYVPGGAYGCGITLSLIRDDVYQVVSAPLLLGGGKLLIEMPAQNEHYQFDAVTLGQDTATDEIYLTDTQVNLGLHLVVDEGYTVQNVRLTGYDENGAVLAQWYAEPIDVGPWNYSSVFTPSEKLAPGGKLTVEAIDKDGNSAGQVDTGYWIKPELKSSSFVLPQFDPHKSVTLPVFGDVSVSTDFGSSNAKPTEPETDLSNLSSGKSTKSPIEIKFGYGSKIKTAIKELKLIDAKGYAAMNAMEKASAITAKLGDLYGYGAGGNSFDGKMENQPWFGQGGGKSAYKVNYNIGLYMSLYRDGMAFEFESLTLFASLTVAGSTTQQFSIAGIPLYLTLNGNTTVEGLITLNPFPGMDTVPLTDPNTSGWITDDLLARTELGGFFLFTVGITIEAGVGHPNIVAGGVKGSMKYRMGYEPWSEAAAIVDLELSAVLHLGPIELPYKITSASYGIFKTDGYQDTAVIDFKKVKNADKFGYATLMSYDDGETLTTVTAAYRQMARAGSVDYGPLTLTAPERTVRLLGEGEQTADGMAVLMEEGDAPGVRVKGLNTCTPISLPLGEGNGWLLLALYDVNRRDVNDCSGLTWRILTRKADDSYETSAAALLDDDGTFDSNLTAARLEGGRVVVVWSSAKHAWGDDPDADLGEMLNDNELKYCIFSADGVPGEVKTLSDLPGCEEVSRVTRDPLTGKTMIVYSVTDYQTEGVCLDENNLENVGNFLYNSYSTVCFKLLDEEGGIITEYMPETESSYSAYEIAHDCSLDGLRYLNTQLSNNQSQAKLDQFSVGAIDGTAYVVYSLDTDQDTGTDGDRELFLVSYDLSTMASAGPVRLTDNLVADANPQLLRYNGRLMLFWNHEGMLSCVDVTETEAETDISERAEVLFCDEVGAANYQAEVDPHSGMLWLCWCGSYTARYEGEQYSRSAVFMRVYDNHYVFTDEDGEPLLDEEGKPVSGAWGRTAPVQIAGQDNAQFSELNVALLGDVPLLSFKETITDESGEPELFILDYATVTFPVMYAVDAGMSPAWPMAGEQVTATVNAMNYGPVPEDLLTLKAELVRTTGETQDLGTIEHDGHVYSDTTVTETFTFTMPEDPENWVLRLTAYEDDVTQGVVKEVPLPCGTAVTMERVATEVLEDTRYAVSLDVGNTGNQPLSGAKLVLEKEPEDLMDANGAGTFETLAAIDLPDVDAKGVQHAYLPFDLPYELCSSGGNNVIWVTVESADGAELAKQEFLIHQQLPDEPAAEKLLINGSETPAAIVLRPNQTTALQVSMLPAETDEGYAITYRTENSGVVTVDENGRLTAVGPGTTTVYADAACLEDTLLIGADNRMTSRNGTITMDEHGILQYTAAEGAALRNSIQVTVTGGNSGADDPYVPAGPAASRSDEMTVEVSSGEGSVTVSVAVKDGMAAISAPTQAQLAEITGMAGETGAVTVDLHGLPETVTAVSIPAGTVRAVNAATKRGGEGLTVKLPGGAVTFDPEALTAITRQLTAEPLTLHVEPIPENRLNDAQKSAADELDVLAVYDIFLTGGNKRITDFGDGRATVTVRHRLGRDKQPGGIVAWYLADDGAKTKLPTGATAQDATFTVPHFSNYALAYDKNLPGACPKDDTCPMAAFTDLDQGAWYHDGVHWALEHGVMNGVGDGAFAPDGDTSRGMLVTMLWRMEGEPKSGYAMTFKDVPQDTWYTEAVRWAAEHGIVTGYDAETFGPTDRLTREQLAVILCRYAVFKGVVTTRGETASLSGFHDAGDVSDWAIQSVRWAVDAGIINGAGSNRLSPKTNASRAQVATMLMRFDSITQ